MIPKIIWQTYKLPKEQLMPYMIDAMNTWIDLNPDYEHRYISDEDALSFIKQHYDKEWFDIFVNVPLGVMRGDIIRYMLIYTYGGVYSDLDTLCIEPINKWMIKEYDMIICPENDVHLCQWTFAAAPGHPIIKSVLDLIKEGFKNPNYEEEHFVHKLTGPSVWTKGIKKALDIPENTRLTEMDKIQLDLPKAKEYKFFSYGSENWRIFHNMYVKHLYGSQNWHEGYDQWIKQIPYSINADITKIRWENETNI
jgi:mannosyltransferase OCH1-like enzyme